MGALKMFPKNTNPMTIEEYTPYGPEWEKDVMKLPKKTIIQLLAKKSKQRDSLEYQLELMNKTVGELEADLYDAINRDE
jgi:hypothetical protein